MNYYPIMLNLKKRPVVVIGGGKVALRKIEGLLKAEAIIKVVAPQIDGQIESLAKKNDSITIIKRNYKSRDFKKAGLIFCATDDSIVNKKIFQNAFKKNILINSADDPQNCSFILPAALRYGDLTIAVSTSGASPLMAVKILEKIKKIIPKNIIPILIALRKARTVLLSEALFKGLSASQRKKILKKIIEKKMFSTLIKAISKEKVIAFLKRIIIKDQA